MQDADTELRNWARWCRGWTGPVTVTNWDLIDSIVYKNCYATTQERLDEVLSQEPVMERNAEQVELWVQQFDPITKMVLKVHYVLMPDEQRGAWDCTWDQWQYRRATITRKELREKQGISTNLDAERYEQMVRDGVGQVQYWINKWAVGV